MAAAGNVPLAAERDVGKHNGKQKTAISRSDDCEGKERGSMWQKSHVEHFYPNVGYPWDEMETLEIGLRIRG